MRGKGLARQSMLLYKVLEALGGALNGFKAAFRRCSKVRHQVAAKILDKGFHLSSAQGRKAGGNLCLWFKESSQPGNAACHGDVGYFLSMPPPKPETS